VAGAFTIVELALEFLFPSFGRALLHTEIRAALHQLYRHPLAIATLLLIEVWIVVHHYHEWFWRHRETATLNVLRELFSPSNQDSASKADRFAEKKQAMRAFALTFKRILLEWGIQNVNICFMEHDPKKEFLVVVFESSGGKDFDPSFKLKFGEGAAGNALERNELIYVPNIKFKHGVAVKPGDVSKSIRNGTKSKPRKLELVENVYKDGKHPFKSILCVPIRALLGAGDTPDASNPAVGVLNMACTGASAFSERDFVIAELAAAIFGRIYDKTWHPSRLEPQLLRKRLRPRRFRLSPRA
jgi:hypothetical protein